MISKMQGLSKQFYQPTGASHAGTTLLPAFQQCVCNGAFQDQSEFKWTHSEVVIGHIW